MERTSAMIVAITVEKNWFSDERSVVLFVKFYNNSKKNKSIQQIDHQDQGGKASGPLPP